ncbi:MAG: glycine cleavage system protein GcvH [Candidatus Omnitrophica bacterium]|nr:glycine cleavage system protein GcvH [Candidatus Omnitrophota bacterium]
MDVEDDLLYTKEHEWISIDEDGATIGITDYAQEQLGDITFVEFPGVGDEVEQFGELASIESVKAASDIYAPMSGVIKEVNTDLEEKPGLINKSCYEKGWLVRIEVSDMDERSNLMTADEYRNFLRSAG